MCNTKKKSSDASTEFNNELLKKMLSLYKIEQHIGTPNNPNSMAIVERFHSTIIEIYRSAKYEQSSLDAASVMAYAIMGYNKTIYSATNFTPFEVVFGLTDSRNAFGIDRDKPLMQKILQDYRKRLKILYEHLSSQMIGHKNLVREKKGREDPPKIVEGDTVFMKNTRTKKAKELPRYEKATVTGKPKRNVVPVKLKNRNTRVALRNFKRPPQMVADTARPSGSRENSEHPEDRSESGNRSDLDWKNSDENY